MTPIMQAMSDFRNGAGMDSKAPESFSEEQKNMYLSEMLRLSIDELERSNQELMGGV